MEPVSVAHFGGDARLTAAKRASNGSGADSSSTEPIIMRVSGASQSRDSRSYVRDGVDRQGDEVGVLLHRGLSLLPHLDPTGSAAGNERLWTLYVLVFAFIFGDCDCEDSSVS